MLTEIDHTRQIKGEPHRRWFEDADCDLIVWDHGGSNIIGFQLCYGKNRDEHALTWRVGCGFSHERVDDGEESFQPYKSTPLLIPDGRFDAAMVVEDFRRRSGSIEPRVAEFILQKLSEYPTRTPENRL